MTDRRNNKIKQAIARILKKFPPAKGYEFKRRTGDRVSFRHTPSNTKFWVKVDINV